MALPDAGSFSLAPTRIFRKMTSQDARRKWMLFRQLIGVMLFLCAPLYAQKNSTFTVKGVVTEIGNKPVDIAYIVFNNSVSVLSDQDGSFQIKNVKLGEYEYYVSCLGYEEVRGKFKFITGKEVLRVQVKPLVLALDEVTVTAKNAPGSKSKIGQDAIRHIQPKSLADMLQLLPGGLTTNPTLNEAAQAQIREIGSDNNNALGTAVLLDGIPLSNDANLQSLSPTKSGLGSTNTANGMNDQTTAGRGVDLRTVAADNIESVEVIRGIPSAEYGNLTSGVVIVKTKSGKTPLEVKFKADPFSKLVYAGKGFNLKRGGAINFGIDWSQSYGDTRRHYLGYDRITASLGYSNIFNAQGEHPVTFNFRSSFYSNIKDRKSDPQMNELQLNFKNENAGVRMAVNGNVKMDNWLTALNYDLSAEFSRSLDSNHNWVSNPDGVITNSMVSGVAPAQFLNKAYFSDYKIEGKPFSVYARVKGHRYIQLSDEAYTNLKAGIDYKMDGNRGEGLTFDMANPPQAMGAHTLRPRSYKDIPTVHILSGFLEDVMNVRLGSTTLNVVGGVRFSNMFLDKEKSGRNSIFVTEPRINLSYTLLDKQNNSLFDDLSITGGFGLSNKMPTLVYLYPDNTYYDNISLSRLGDTESQSLALMTTTVVTDTKNTDLKPLKSRKWEVGMNFRIGKVNGYVTYFNEKYRNEFGFSSNLVWLKYNHYNLPHGADNLSFRNGQVHYTLNGQNHTATTSAIVDMDTWGRPDNNSKSDKHGIEYGFNFGTLPFIKTSLNVDGAWFHINRQGTQDHLRYLNRNYDFVPVMPAGEGTIQNRINTNFRFITHIPKVSMIFTTTVQVVWHEDIKSIYQGGKGEDLYHLSSDGERFIVSPQGFYDRQGGYTQWQPSFENHPDYQLMNGSYMLYGFKADTVHPWVLLNFRFTKELGRIAELSFTANNFANTSKWHINDNTKGKRQLYPDMYFGAELKFKF